MLQITDFHPVSVCVCFITDNIDVALSAANNKMIKMSMIYTLNLYQLIGNVLKEAVFQYQLEASHIFYM